jgi:SAM-dependent methyltransferase
VASVEYTGDVKRDGPALDVRNYYRRILPFYEKEAGSTTRSERDFWRELARDSRPERILDVGAGLGRITSLLARFAPTIGTDISLEMLQGAVRRLRPQSRARFVAADMRRPALTGRFDLIIASGDPFSHLTSAADRRRALRAVAELLSDGGRFVLEGLYRRRGIFEPPTRRIRHSRGVLSVTETWRPVGSRQLWRARYRYRDRLSTGEVDEGEASFVARAWDPAEMRALFASCGLEIEQLWGDFDRRPFRSGAKRLVVVAVRASGPVSSGSAPPSGRPERANASRAAAPRRAPVSQALSSKPRDVPRASTLRRRRAIGSATARDAGEPS